MTVTLVDNGTLAAGTTSATPAHLATASAGDLLLVPCWSSSSDDVTPTISAGYNLLGSITGGTGSHGPGTGPRTTTVFWRIADGTETIGSTITLSNGGAGGVVVTGHILRLTKTLKSWALNFTTANDSSAGASLNLNGGTDPDGEVGDLLYIIASYAQSSVTLSSPVQVQNGLAWTGATLGSGNQLRNSATTQGDDLRQLDGFMMVTAGASSVAPTLTLTTLSGSVDGGAGVFVRVREQDVPSPRTTSQYMSYI